MESLCGICSSTHETSACTSIEIKSHIHDTIVPSRARLSLPYSLEIQKLADGFPVVFAKCLIEKGTKFGPFVAKRILTLNPSASFPIKIFTEDSEDFSEYYLDNTDENECNWMVFVAAAENIEEQNLICYQDKHDIYYVSLRDVKSGEQLRVWYSTHYAARIKANQLPSKKTIDDEKLLSSLDLSKLITKQQHIMQRDSWSCKFCGTVESNVVDFSTHILEHYVLQLRKVCETCHEGFATRKGLKKHLKIVHSGNPPDQAKTSCFKNNDMPENKKKDAVIGGPLLNDVLADSLDNSMLQQPDFELENQNILIESDNLSVDNILNENVKELEHFNFEINETEERFVCDICLKAFGKLKLLVQHLKKHTAKYVCYKCTKVFCRNENLKSHICNNSLRIECPQCKKSFTQRKYLTRHVAVKHSKKFSCTSCAKIFNSSAEKHQHNCVNSPDKQTFPCMTCNKTFHQECYLRKHMRTHSSLHPKNNTTGSMCESCGKKFSDRRTLRQHMITHQERMLECNVCGKKFGRKEVLNNHLMTHSVPQFKCEACGKSFKVKKNLKMHAQLHNKTQSYKCEECPKIFHNKSNMLKHRKSVHNKTCVTCHKKFSSAELREAHAVEHLNSYYVCPFCNKIVKLRNSLVRHLKKQHEQESVNLDLSRVKAVTKRSSQEEVQNVNRQAQIPQTCVLNLNELEVADFEVQQNLNCQEVCLLANSDQGLTLGPDAYVLQHGARELNKVVLYVLDEFPKV